MAKIINPETERVNHEWCRNFEHILNETGHRAIIIMGVDANGSINLITRPDIKPEYLANIITDLNQRIKDGGANQHNPLGLIKPQA